jgi:hypothetical protein
MIDSPAPTLQCPFCGSELTDRIDIDGTRFLVFRCMFTPEVDSKSSDEQIREHLRTLSAGGGDPYFRGMCDRLHGYVTRGEGARILTGSSPDP